MVFVAADEVPLHEIEQYSAYYLFLNIFLLPKDPFFILFAITAAGVMPCGSSKKSPRTSSVVQIIFFFLSFEISKYIQGVQNTFRNIILRIFFQITSDPV